jgi:hypothetical protein
MDDFARMNAGTLSPAEFFAPPHVEAMLDEAAAREPIEAAADRPIVVQPPADRLCGQFEPG